MLVPLNSAAPEAYLMTLKLGSFVLMVATQKLLWYTYSFQINPLTGTHEYIHVQKINDLQNKMAQIKSSKIEG